MNNFEQVDLGVHAIARQHARIYQQGQGLQLNIDNAVFNPETFGNTPWADEYESWPLVQEVDPLEIGVHRAPVSRGNAVPVYVKRDIDDDVALKLAQVLQRGGMLVLIGDSTAGKTRTAYEAALTASPDRRLCKPYNRGELRHSLVAMTAHASDAILWLDDLEEYVGTDGINSAVVAYLRRTRIATIATIRSEQYRRYIKPSERSDLEHHTISDFQKIIDQSQSIVLPRRWSDDEVARARESGDTRVVEAAHYSDAFGVAEYLAAGPSLLDEWQLAWGPEANPRGASMIAAAVDCARAGLYAPIPQDVLVDLHQRYLEDAGGELLRPEPISRALAWATRRRAGVASPLIPLDSGKKYRAFDYLVDSVMRSEHSQPIPDDVWRKALDFAKFDIDLLFSVASAARRENVTEIEVDGWMRLADAGDSRGAKSLGLIQYRADRLDDAVDWFEKAAQSGDAEGWTFLGLIAERRSNFSKAEENFRKAAEAGSTHAMNHLASLLQSRGDRKESEEWFRRALSITADGSDISINLASLLIDVGRFEEAEEYLRKQIEGGNDDGFSTLGYLYAKTGKLAEARDLWRKAAHNGSREAAWLLGVDSENEGRLSDAEHWWLRALDLGMDRAALSLGVMLEDANRLEEAEKLFQDACEKQVAGADAHYAVFLEHRGRREEAEQRARSSYESGNQEASYLVAQIRYKQNRGMEEVTPWLERAAQGGNRRAQSWLGNYYMEINELEKAKRWLSLANDGSDPAVACDLGTVLGRLGDFKKAKKLLRESADEGHVHAACNHGHLLLQLGDEAGAIERFRAAYFGGHDHVASLIAKLYAKNGNGREAAIWLRRTNGGQAKQGAVASRQKKKRRRKGGKR